MANERIKKEKTPEDYAEQILRILEKTGLVNKTKRELELYDDPKYAESRKSKGYHLRRIVKMTLSDVRDKEEFEKLIKSVEQFEETFNKHLKRRDARTLVEIIQGAIAGKCAMEENDFSLVQELTYGGFAGTYIQSPSGCLKFREHQMMFTKNSDGVFRYSENGGNAFECSVNNDNTFEDSDIGDNAFHGSSNNDNAFERSVISGNSFKDSINDDTAFSGAKSSGRARRNIEKGKVNTPIKSKV